MSAVLESSPLPSRLAIRNLVGDLVGRDVDLKDGTPIKTAPTNVIAVYVNDKLAVSAVVVCDLAAAARLGGALGLLPKGGIDDAIKDKELPELVRDCVYEVLNVFAAAFNVGGAPHVRLYQLFGPGETVPADIASLAASLGSREDVMMSVAGYGAGNLSVVVR